MHGLVVAGFLLFDLLQEARRLVFRVVQFGKAVGDLAADDEEFETVGDVVVGVVAAGQG